MSEDMAITWYPSPHFDDRLADTQIRFLVMHYTACDFQKALHYLTQSVAPNRVSAHYLIDEDGTILQLVHEDKRAWHAGSSAWGQYENLNTWSIGIELVNPGHQLGYRSFPEPQIKSLIQLSHRILKRYNISPQHVLGHSDIAPLRKQDPGELFNWKLLAQEGIGLYPEECPLDAHHLDIASVQALLSLYGYRIVITGQHDNQTKAVLKAFQMHFSPERVDGTIYPEMVGKLETLVRMVSGEGYTKSLF